MRADLHLHSTYSDGTMDPVELAWHAWRSGLGGIAITDHDAWRQNDRLAGGDLPPGLCWVPGIELSTDHARTGLGFHVLGYGLAPDEAFRRMLHATRDARRQRIRDYAEALERVGIPIDADAILARSGSPGKPDIARAALAVAGPRLRAEGAGGVGAFIEAYLEPGCPAFAPKRKVSTVDAVAAVRRCGGHPVWAHPALDLRAIDGARRPDERKRILAELVEAGLEGVETRNFVHDRQEAAELEELARGNGLRTTAGSDFHGPEDDHDGRLLLDIDQDITWLH